MAGVIRRMVDGYYYILEHYSDPRTKDWPLMSSPLPTLAICLTYAFVVKVAGPKLMENRKPFKLQKTLIVYNALQVLFSYYLFREALHAGWFTTYSFRCQPVDYSYSDHALRVAAGCWWYYFSKFTEFLDTIFFVLRKKNDHVNKLHVIHHGIMPLSTWFGVKFTPGGHSTFFGMLNTFVHIIMYTYYMLAAMGPKVQPYLWWKKYLTVLQMVQFILILVHAFQLLFIDCNYPRAFVWFIGLHAVMFYFLFKDFYNQAYKAKKSKKAVLAGTINFCQPEPVQAYQEPLSQKLTNGYVTNGELRNRVFVDSNGHANGHANGHTNGHANGHANGKH